MASTARSDAQRNRRRLLEAALRELSRDESVPLERIAREAGVGIGTLYRHFPTREALTEAVYRSELEELCAGAPALLDDLPADAALRTWMSRYADFVATKRGMAGALRGLLGSGAITSTQTRQEMSHAIDVLLRAGSDTGVLRDDVPAEDVTASLAGVLMAVPPDVDGAPAAQVERMLDLLLDGLRPR